MALSYEKYLNDIKTTCEVYGVWQMISPGRRTCGEASPLWGSAQVIIPWNLYLYYNDVRVLELYYDLMAKWVEHLKEKSENLLITYGLGDWCPPVGHNSDKRIPVHVSSTAEFYHCADLMAQVADILNKPEDAAYFKHLAQDIGAVFNENFLNRETHSYGTQGGSAVALTYGICPEDEREAVLQNLLHMIHEECDGAMTTGIYGNKYLAPALTEAGHGGEMLALATNPEKTSFRTMLENGATSMWEIINDLPKTGGMPSLNHPMHTAFTSWFYSHILGIRPILAAPGFKKFQIKPWIFGEIESASGSYRSAYGEIKVRWQTEGGTFRLEVTVPANTEAALELPGKEGLCVDGKPYIESAKTDDRICLTLGSGTYCITTTL